MLSDDDIAAMRAKAAEWTGEHPIDLRGGPLDGMEVAWPGHARYLAACCATEGGLVQALYECDDGVGTFAGFTTVGDELPPRCPVRSPRAASRH